MAKIDITKTELVWPGKYNEDGTRKEAPRVSLPFQVIETINESRVTREATKFQPSLFDIYEGKEGDTFEEGWQNKLIWGDNLLVMGSLLEKFAGKIDLIYIDPPFATGADFSFTTEIGDSALEVTKEQSIIEEKAYRDTWGSGLSSYLSMLSQRLILLRELLSDKGSIYVHIGWDIGGYVLDVMNEIFGEDCLQNIIVYNFGK
jgi:adenine specific DNA methylase Mod